MRKLLNDVFVLMLMSYFSKGLCTENEEETKIGVEYMQIFRNIPSLFEYFLDVLEQRVEILERDDLTAYQVRSDEFDASESENKNEVKRETEPYFDYENDSLYDKENIDTINNNDETYHGGNTYKRQNSFEAFDGAYTTEVYEYGRANAKIPNIAQKEVTGDFEGPIQEKVKRENIKNEFINKPFSERLSEMNNHKEKSVKNRDKYKEAPVKRNVIQLEDNFASTDWSQFNLSPEEVEEKAIRTEQIIEEHNKKNRNK